MSESGGSESGCCEFRCAVCHRPVRRNAKGRPKEVHTKCCIVRSRLAEMETLLSTMEFGDRAAVRRLRGDLFALVNNTLRSTKVTINASDSRDI